MDKTKLLFASFRIGLIGLCCPAVFGEAKGGRVAPDSIRREVVDGEVYVIHEVGPRENYYAIGRRYNAPPKAIMRANGNKNLKPGLIVRIPTGRQDGQQSQRPTSRAADTIDPQSVLTEYRVGERETLYGIARRFGTSMAAIKKMNRLDSDALKAGWLLKIPNENRAADTIDPQSVLTEYRVGERETLYGIARRFGTSVAAIKKMNRLGSDALKVGSLLKIPNENHAASPAENARLPVVITPKKTPAMPNPTDLGFETNPYGLREKTEKGIGVWMEHLETDGQSNLALHRTAPVGTILKVTNPMSKNVTYAKVVGKFAENAETRDAIVVLSKSAAAYIGALDKRFLIEIAYGQSP